MTNPGALLGKAMAFQGAKLILTGLELGLFDRLASGPATVEKIRAELDLGDRGTEHFLAALTEIGILELDGEQYALGEEARTFLVSDSPASLGGFLHVADKVMYPAWEKLGESLRTGQPQAATYSSGDDMFDQLYGDEDKQSDFVGMAEDASRPLIPILVDAFDWAAHTSVLELGGCRGNVLATLVKAHPHLAATVLDLPQLEPAFTAHMAELGTTGQVGFHSADFFTEELPAADVIMIGHCMVDWTDEQRKALIANVFPSVKPGGAFLIWDPMLVKGDEGYLRNLVRSLNLQLMTPHGTNYHVESCVDWLRVVGFVGVEHSNIGHDVTLVVARKS